MGAVLVPRAARTATAATDPTVSSDAAAGFRVGDWWFNSATGNAFYATDVTAGAALWRHVPRRLGGSAVAASGPADTNENILATINIPAGAMGLNGILRVTHEWSYTNGANNKTPRVRFGGIGGTAYASGTFTTTAAATGQFNICNRNAANSQFGRPAATSVFSGWPGGTGNTVVTSAIDTAVATTLVFTGQKASAGDTLTLESYLVELILP